MMEMVKGHSQKTLRNKTYDFISFKRDSLPKNENSVIIYSTSMSFFLLSNVKSILKNVGNQKADSSHWLPLYFFFILWNTWNILTLFFKTATTSAIFIMNLTIFFSKYTTPNLTSIDQYQTQ